MMARAPLLGGLAGVRHGFFGRRGGVSRGIYASLNCGYGSADAGDLVAENRARVARLLGVPPDRMVTVHQVHSADVVTASRPWSPAAAPRGDAMVTRVRGLALGILAADCAPVLLADAAAGVVGAAHAGWRGALAGVVEATLAAMQALGADAAGTVAAVGPAISRSSYQVGPEFPESFVRDDPESGRFFSAAGRGGRRHFDLAGYVAWRLERAGTGKVAVLGRDTCARSGEYFSYRRSRRRGEADYGRNLSAICLAEQPCPT